MEEITLFRCSDGSAWPTKMEAIKSEINIKAKMLVKSAKEVKGTFSVDSELIHSLNKSESLIKEIRWLINDYNAQAFIHA